MAVLARIWNVLEVTARLWAVVYRGSAKPPVHARQPGSRGNTHMPRAHARHCVRACSLVLVAMLSAVATGVRAAAPATIVSQVPQWPAHPDWQRFVMAPTAPDVAPVRIVSTAGSVSGAASLVGSGGGRATLTMTPGGRSPVMVVDYGQDVGGIPYFIVQSESGTPLLHSAYSEGLGYLGPQGDQTPPNSPTGDPNRFDDLIVDSPGMLTTGTIQGGERYERISLTSPGRVTLTSIGIRFTAVRATANDYRGWFDSSSPELDRIWYDGAYTTQLDELPPDAAPSPWTIEAGALHAVMGTVGILHQGVGWADYTMTFDTRVVDNQAGWLVRASSSSSGYLLVLHHAASGTSTSSSLIEIALGPTEFATIGQVVLPKSFDAAAWHHVTTQVSGSTITTSLDGRQVASFHTDALPAGTSVYGTGSVGFAELGSSAVFRDLDVTSPTGATLYANSLSDRSALSDFSGSGHRDLRSPARDHGRGQARSGGLEWRPRRGDPERALHDRSRRLRARLAPAPRQLPGSRRRDGHERQPDGSVGHVPPERIDLLDLVLHGRGRQHRHLLPLHR